ncbi:hypothetical protein DMA11_13800 [Marinilabiliaceae bacterium JC017]|nr:hypothetical protein DMA11_13800 [Marinilabiliaceae bacterium JC017]
MGKISIVNALGVRMKLIEGSPYTFDSTEINAESSITAEVNKKSFEKFILELEAPNGVRYRYNLNKDHWYGGNGVNHYPNLYSKVNIILCGDRGSYIETKYNYGPEDDSTICTYSSDSKALDKK